MKVATYLCQEGFEEERKGRFFSREITTLVTSTMSPTLWDITINEMTYKDIGELDIPKAVECIHRYSGTALVVALYNLQRDVVIKKIYPIREDL